MHPEVEKIARDAVACRYCFEHAMADSAAIDIAQPRMIGRSYWHASPRIVVVMLNPGSGEFRADSADAELKVLIRAFAEGKGTLDDVFAHQWRDVAHVGRGRFQSFYVNGLGLKVDQTAFLNIAWCATAGNKYPSQMLHACFARHTERMLQALNPDAVILSGSKAHSFRDAICKAVPSSKVVETLHYAHRKAQAVEEVELQRVRAAIRRLNRSPGG